MLDITPAVREREITQALRWEAQPNAVSIANRVACKLDWRGKRLVIVQLIADLHMHLAPLIFKTMQRQLVDAALALH